jgi:hypothetical protein
MAAAGCCGMSPAQLAKMEALDSDETARLDELLRKYHAKQQKRRERAERGEGASRCTVVQRIATYPRLLQARCGSASALLAVRSALPRSPA